MRRKTLTPFGVMVRRALLEKRMLQVELTDMLGIKQQYLTLILCGKRSPGKYLDKILHILDIPIEDYQKIA